MTLKASAGYGANISPLEASQTKVGSDCLWRLPNISRETGGADHPLDGLVSDVTHLERTVCVSSDVGMDGVSGELGLTVGARTIGRLAKGRLHLSCSRFWGLI